jgi:hypothetical protein
MESLNVEIDLAEIRNTNSRAINRIRSLIPGLLAAEESERNWINASRSVQKYLPDLENDSILRSQADIS